MYTYKNDSTFSIYAELCQKYEVIIFDCQSGYTDILKLILPIVDINLVVMESDSISSASIRSLFLKIGDIINEKKIYQTFNKASEEEYGTYSKISGGTVFTNIETIKFDWKIRKAFSVAQIPDMENTSANFGSQIYNICTILFPDDTLQDKLKKIKVILDMHTANEKEKEIKSAIKDLRTQYSNTKSKSRMSLVLLSALLCAFATTITFFFMVWNRQMYDIDNTIYMLFPLVASLLVGIIAMMNIWDVTREGREYQEQIERQQKELETINENKNNLLDILDNNKKANQSDIQNKNINALSAQQTISGSVSANKHKTNSTKKKNKLKRRS